MKRIGLPVAGFFALLALAMAGRPLHAADAGVGERNGFVAIALHDVVDTRAQLDEDSVTSDRLVVLLEWLAGNGWTAISLDDIERARNGGAPLPPKAVLITVDDGLGSLYTRVYPLAVAYRMPVVAALVGQWMDVPAGGKVHYGERELPREAFITWQQAREMQASGWIEFASHSDAMHTVVRTNPQGNLLPAGQNRIRFDDRYEADAEFRARIRADLARSRERLRAELGREPRAIVWPYGRYNEDSLAVAKELGFAFAMTLEPGPATAANADAIPRFLPTADPELGTWVANLSLDDPWPSATRVVAFDPAQLVGANAAQTDANLGRAIDRLVALGATHVMLDAGTVGDDGSLQTTWFPNSQVPMRVDVLGRFAAQMRARRGQRDRPPAACGGVASCGRSPARTGSLSRPRRPRSVRRTGAAGRAVAGRHGGGRGRNAMAGRSAPRLGDIRRLAAGRRHDDGGPAHRRAHASRIAGVLARAGRPSARSPVRVDRSHARAARTGVAHR